MVLVSCILSCPRIARVNDISNGKQCPLFFHMAELLQFQEDIGCIPGIPHLKYEYMAMTQTGCHHNVSKAGMFFGAKRVLKMCLARTVCSELIYFEREGNRMNILEGISDRDKRATKVFVFHPVTEI